MASSRARSFGETPTPLANGNSRGHRQVLVNRHPTFIAHHQYPGSGGSTPVTTSFLLPATMISRASLGRPAQVTLRRQCLIERTNRRGLAAPASGTFSYETSEAAGVKIASRDLPGPMTTVAVVARAGTRYQVLPGFADGLENFAFKVSLLPYVNKESSAISYVNVCCSI